MPVISAAIFSLDDCWRSITCADDARRHFMIFFFYRAASSLGELIPCLSLVDAGSTAEPPSDADAATASLSASFSHDALIDGECR